MQRALLVRADDSMLRTIDDFAGRRIAVTCGSTAEQDVLMRKPPSAQVVYTAHQGQSLEDLVAGRIDAYATGDAGAQYLAERSGGRLAVVDIHPFEPPEQFAFPLRAASRLTAALNAYIESHGSQY